MELRSGDIAARHGCGDRAAIVGDGQHVVVALRLEMVGVHEIGMQPVGARADPGKQRMVALELDRVPADLRDFQRRIGRLDLLDVAGDPAEAARHGLFQPALRHQLHADADAEERPRPGDGYLLDRLGHAGHGVEPGAAVGIGADARQHDAVGGAHALGIRRQVDLGGYAGLTRGALECLGRRAQIARAVVDDRDAHLL